MRSDEFINSKLYTNTQKIQVIDLLESQKQNQYKNEGKGMSGIKGSSLIADGGSYSSIYNKNLMKTANSFFPMSSDMEKGNQMIL